MNQNFNVNIDGNFNFDITSTAASQLDLIKTSTVFEHLLYDNKSYEIEIIEEDFNTKSYKLKINNKTFNVHINNALDVLIKDLGFEIGSSAIVSEITAPMPGLILEMIAKIGDEVKESDPLLILEAMKMENVISSPREGIIKSIAVNKGDAVDKNQILIEFE